MESNRWATKHFGFCFDMIPNVFCVVRHVTDFQQTLAWACRRPSLTSHLCHVFAQNDKCLKCSMNTENRDERPKMFCAFHVRFYIENARSWAQLLEKAIVLRQIFARSSRNMLAHTQFLMLYLPSWKIICLH